MPYPGVHFLGRVPSHVHVGAISCMRRRRVAIDYALEYRVVISFPDRPHIAYGVQCTHRWHARSPGCLLWRMQAYAFCPASQLMVPCLPCCLPLSVDSRSTNLRLKPAPSPGCSAWHPPKRHLPIHMGSDGLPTQFVREAEEGRAEAHIFRSEPAGPPRPRPPLGSPLVR